MSLKYLILLLIIFGFFGFGGVITFMAIPIIAKIVFFIVLIVFFFSLIGAYKNRPPST